MKEKHTNFTTNQLRIRNRIIQEAKYMIENHASCHETAKHFQTNAFLFGKKSIFKRSIKK